MDIINAFNIRLHRLLPEHLQIPRPVWAIVTDLAGFSIDFIISEFIHAYGPPKKAEKKLWIQFDGEKKFTYDKYTEMHMAQVKGVAFFIGRFEGLIAYLRGRNNRTINGHLLQQILATAPLFAEFNDTVYVIHEDFKKLVSATMADQLCTFDELIAGNSTCLVENAHLHISAKIGAAGLVQVELRLREREAF